MSSCSPTRWSSARVLALLAALVATCLLAAPAAAAQPVLTGVQVGSVAGQVQLVVRLPDAAGAPPPAAFTVSVDGAPRPTTARPLLGDRLAMGLVVDASGDGSQQLADGLGGAAGFVLSAPTSTRGALVLDRSPPAVAAPWPAQPADVLRDLSAVRPDGARQTAAALAVAADQLAAEPGDPRLVTLYTCAADAGDASVAAVVDRLRSRGAVLAVVEAGAGPAGGVASPFWTRVATATGGVAVRAAPEGALAAFDEVTAQLGRRYLVSFPAPARLPATAAVRVGTAGGTLTADVPIARPAGEGVSGPVLAAGVAAAAVVLAAGASAVAQRMRRRRTGSPAGAVPGTPVRPESSPPAGLPPAGSPPAGSPPPGSPPGSLGSPPPGSPPGSPGSPPPGSPPGSPGSPPAGSPLPGSPPAAPPPGSLASPPAALSGSLASTPGPGAVSGARPASTSGPRAQPPLAWSIPGRLDAPVERPALLAEVATALRAGGPVRLRAPADRPGVGVTTTMVDFAHRHRARYDVAWWVPAPDPDLVADRLAELAEALGLATAADSADRAVAALLDALANRDRWLLAFPDAAGPRDLVPFLPRGPGHVLVASADPGWAGHARAVDVPPFDRAGSVSLLRAARPDLPAASADRVAAALGDLPLALAPAAAALADRTLDADALVALAAEPPGDPATAVWTARLERLASEEPAASALLSLVAWLGRAPVPFTLLTAHPTALPDVLRPAPDARLDTHVGVLRRRNLAVVADEQLVLHRVPAELLMARTAGQHADDGGWPAVAVRLLRAAAPPDPAADPASVRAWRLLLPHVIAATDPARPLEFVAGDVRWLLARAGAHLAARGRAKAAKALIEDAGGD